MPEQALIRNIRPDGERQSSVAPDGEVHHLAANQVVLEEGDFTPRICRIDEGAVTLFRMLPHGTRQILGFACAGDYVAIGALGNNIIDAEAVKSSRLTTRSISQNKRSDSGNAAEVLAELVASTNALVHMANQPSAAQQVASLLLSFQKRKQSDKCSPETVILPISLQQIASFYNVSIASLERTLAVLKQHGFIDLLKDGRLTIVGIEKLRRLATGETTTLVCAHSSC